MRHGRLTYAGLLLFGENPTTYLPAAVVQCVRFHGTTITAPLESIDLQGSVPELIVNARDFIATLARVGELPTADGAYAQATYRYPMIAVREIIANAVVHRDYSDQESCVQIHVFADRIEITSPGKWGGSPVTEPGERLLGKLERRSQRRNFRLAQTLTWSKLVEGVGAGVPRAIADCESTGAPEPVVANDEHIVQVTIYPRPPQEPERAQIPAGRLLAEVIDPFDLEVHHPLSLDGLQRELPELPAYVPREHDQALAGVVAAAAGGRQRDRGAGGRVLHGQDAGVLGGA